VRADVTPGPLFHLSFQHPTIIPLASARFGVRREWVVVLEMLTDGSRVKVLTALIPVALVPIRAASILIASVFTR
jgi:hypothetical protein